DYTSLRKGEKPKKDVAERNQRPIEAKEKSKPDSPIESPVEEPKIVIPPSQAPVKPNVITDNKAIPTLTEIIDFAKTLPKYDPSLDSRIQERYESWVNNGWRTLRNDPIKDWEPLLKATLPF
ncbi:hypothetical protein HAP39_20410, partial [Elizabethkingia miricola]|nr:hypothetical protein [Elizabethkingia miricola]